MKAIKPLLNGLLHRIGLDLRTVHRETWAGANYESLRPWAAYAPWRKDGEFMRIYNIVAEYTLVDLYRCWELWDLAWQCARLPGDFLEVGAWRGGTAGILCARAAQCGEPRTVYIADTFSGVVKSSKKDPRYRDGEHSDTSADTVVSLLRDKLGVRNYKILKGIFPEETGHLSEHEPLSLCHIDVDVYQSAKDVMEWCWPRLSPGGVVVFDDYGFDSTPGITEYVDEVKRDTDCLSFYNLNGHAVLVKLSG
jgi:O-methyltransferase